MSLDLGIVSPAKCLLVVQLQPTSIRMSSHDPSVHIHAWALPTSILDPLRYAIYASLNISEAPVV